jgi:hypothetical protein
MTTTYQTADNKLVPRLVKHVNTKGGNFKGVCVSACLGYFNIHPDQYKFTWSKRTGNNHHAILRRFGWSVRSRKSSLLKADYTEDTMYLIHVMGHVLLLNSNGQTVVDTSPRKVDRRKVYNVVAIFKDKP